MNKNKRGGSSVYPSDLKIALAREYISGELSFGELSKKYGFPAETIRHFTRWYKQHFPDSSVEIPTPPIKPPGRVSAEDKAIAKQLAEANLKIAALEMLIENAGKELGVNLRKKPGTGQSVK